MLREKPAMPSSALKLAENVSDNMEQDNDENTKGGLLGLPESDTELDVRFSNSLIIQEPKTKEIMHRNVFGYLMKNLFLHP